MHIAACAVPPRITLGDLGMAIAAVKFPSCSEQLSGGRETGASPGLIHREIPRFLPLKYPPVPGCA